MSDETISTRLRRANLTNIVKKLNAGKTLTKAERTALDEHEAVNSTGRRLRKKELAAELGISRVTLDDYLNRPDPPAPKPDNNQAYSVEDVAAYIAANSTKAAVSPAMRKMREARERIRLEREEMELAELRGQLIDKSMIAPAIAAVMTQLTTDLVDVFENELPTKYNGLSTVQCAELNASGVDRVLTRFKSGNAPLMQ